MKKNIKDHDIFDDVPPIDISKHVPKESHFTTEQMSCLQLTKTVHVGGGCYGTVLLYRDKECIWNTTENKLKYNPCYLNGRLYGKMLLLI